MESCVVNGILRAAPFSLSLAADFGTSLTFPRHVFLCCGDFRQGSNTSSVQMFIITVRGVRCTFTRLAVSPPLAVALAPLAFFL